MLGFPFTKPWATRAWFQIFHVDIQSDIGLCMTNFTFEKETETETKNRQEINQKSYFLIAELYNKKKSA